MYFKKRIFSISSARSGSTWLSNIIRSDPHILFFNEIISGTRDLLPKSHKVWDSRKGDLKQAFESDLEKLLKYKIPFGYNIVNRYLFIKIPVMLFCKIVAHVLSKLLSQQQKSWNPFVKIWNINSLYEPLFTPFFITQFLKVKEPNIFYIKEILPYKAWFFLKESNPKESLFIHLLRNPFGVVSSEKRFINTAKISFISKRLLGKEYPEYKNLISKFETANFTQKIAINWRIENELIYRNIEKENQSNNLFILYEDLCNNFDNTIKKIFDFLQLDISPQTKDFILKLKVQQTTQKHSRATVIKKKKQSLIPSDLSTNDIKDIYDIVRDSFLLKNWIELDSV